jgi:protein-L-isoaspartate(D-aspartate) O-methyltransferase
MTDARLDALRLAYAHELRDLAQLTHQPIIDAFAAVPREHFMGPGPWKTYGGDLTEGMTPDADPAHIYKNILVALDAAKRLNNGEPRFWAYLFQWLRPMAGERVIHVGAGTGYYTALLAHMVGPTGSVTGVEFEPDLAARARASLADQPNVEILAGDGMALAQGEADVIVASCGLDVVPVGWVRLLRDGGRMLIPLTYPMDNWSGGGVGGSLLIRRRGDRYRAGWAGNVAIYNCMIGRSSEAGERLKAAFALPSDPAALADYKRPPIASLRLDGAPDETCWLAGDGWWLSTAPA